ncbi:unnamed protein product [Cylicocyclus nassatus]|uniref:Uncharacterized protein n=1 Tax=Cylicocyclus nassatus TaxID=53992 RepID=A0AA36MAN0_CYLNA|nr:unnamed protein product [Cylicocyclus nassatus]
MNFRILLHAYCILYLTKTSCKIHHDLKERNNSNALQYTTLATRDLLSHYGNGNLSSNYRDFRSRKTRSSAKENSTQIPAQKRSIDDDRSQGQQNRVRINGETIEPGKGSVNYHFTCNSGVCNINIKMDIIPPGQEGEGGEDDNPRSTESEKEQAYRNTKTDKKVINSDNGPTEELVARKIDDNTIELVRSSLIKDDTEKQQEISGFKPHRSRPKQRRGKWTSIRGRKTVSQHSTYHHARLSWIKRDDRPKKIRTHFKRVKNNKRRHKALPLRTILAKSKGIYK